MHPSDDDEQDGTIYAAVINDEGQYSIWPVERALPIGWHETGTRGLKADCLAYIDRTWTDMRPLSLRRAMQVDNNDTADDAKSTAY